MSKPDKKPPFKNFEPEIVEIFRAALMKRHADDWDMEIVAEAAYTCAEAIQPYVEVWRKTLEHRPGSDKYLKRKSYR